MLSDSWEALTDGLHVQRLHLHQNEIRQAGERTAAECLLPDELPPAALLARPRPPGDTIAELRAWVTLPQTFTVRTAAGPGRNPLAETGQTLTDALATGTSIDDELAAVCAASVWWVGAFAAIRYTGGHHRTLADVTTPVSPDALRRAVHVVALGAATRVLRRALQRDGDGDAALRMSFCRSITEAVVVEPGLPALVEELGELRLADLVTNALPGRGRHAAYRSGLGPGQAE